MVTTRKAKFHRGCEFDSMARRPMYSVCPRWLLEHCDIGETSTVADLGCGSGIFTQFLLERLPGAAGLRIVAIDPSEWELAIMRSRVDDDRVTFVLGRVQDVAALVPELDAVVLCNVLHQIPLSERRTVLEGVFGMLRPGGSVGANTLFYDGGIYPGTAKFYTTWMLQARGFLKQRSIRIEVPDEQPVALQRLSAEQHRDLFEVTGFTDIEIEEVETDWLVEDWEALSKYSVFIEGALGPGIDLPIGSAALIEGVRAAYRTLGLDSVKRGWLHCAARKPGQAEDRH